MLGEPRENARGQLQKPEEMQQWSAEGANDPFVIPTPRAAKR